ncbi:MAG: porin [candidate division Zixibacteria bacterium]|nr:porin [candidate division Zixibacteria bacterium]
MFVNKKTGHRFGAVFSVVLLLVFVVCGSVAAQDLGQILKAVNQVEADLQAKLDQEATARTEAIAKLRADMNNLESGQPGTVDKSWQTEWERKLAVLQSGFEKLSVAYARNSSEGVSDEQWQTIAIEIASLKAENLALKEMVDKKTAQWASLDGGLPTPNETPTSTSPFTEPWSGLSFNGFVDASNYNDHNAGEGSFGLDQVEVDLVQKLSDQASANADIEYVSDGMGGFGMDLEQGYLQWNVGSGQTWSFTFGKFNAPIGFELLDAPDMYQYSHALVFDNGIPGNLTGLMVATEFAAMVDWTFYLVNGWDVNTDNNKDKTFGTRVGFTPAGNLNFGLSAITGPEQDQNNSSRRTVIDFDLTYNPAAFWTIGGEFNYGTETKALVGNKSGNWSGFLLMNNWTFGDRFGLTTRFDLFNDADGLRTGTEQSWKAICISPSMSIVDGLCGLIELRYDFSDEDTFTASDGTPKDNQFSSALEFTYGF